MKSTISFNAPPNIRKVASSIAAAAETAIDAYREGRISDEPNITDRWLGAVENSMRSFWQPRGIRRGKPGIIWQAKTLRTGRGIAAEEKRYGADLLGVAEIHIGDRMIRKGFLGQSKRTEPGTPLERSEWDRLVNQAKDMLARTPASFVLAYSRHYGIVFIPAITVASVDHSDLFDLNIVPLKSFFELHLGCFIGDGRLSAPNITTLDGLDQVDILRDFPVRNILHLIIRVEGE